MISKIELLKKIVDRGIKPFTWEPSSGVNLLVGENGCGKSSLIKFVTQKDPAFNITCDENNKHIYFDSEHDNPATRNGDEFRNDVQALSFIVSSRFESHGETLFPIVNLVKDNTDHMIFLDEPESGLSIKRQLTLVRSIKKAVKNNCQFFIATHSYIIIKKFKEVFDMDKLETVKSKDWLSKYKI